MLRFYGLAFLLHFNSILSTNLENYINNCHFEVVEKVFDIFKVDLLDKCFTDTWPMVIVGPMLIKANELFPLNTNKTIYLLDVVESETERFENKEIIFTPEKYYSTSVTTTKFVILISNTKSLQSRLNKLKNSAFWNIYGYFLVINVKNCLLIYAHLQIIWEFNILNAVYCCHHPSHGVHFYIFNPFNEEAPKNWKKIGTVYQKNKHPMRIFGKPAKSESESEDVVANCRVFLFEKVNNLSGYPIKVAEVNEYVNIPDVTGKVHTKNIFEFSQKHIRLLWTHLGAMVDYESITQDELGMLLPDGGSNGVVSQVLQGRYECRSDLDYHRGFWQHEMNLFAANGLCYTTRKDLAPITEQLEKAFPLRLRIFFLIFFGAVICIYVYTMKNESGEVALDILRAAIGQGMICRPTEHLASFIFSGLVFTFMVITMDLQSLLNAIVTASLTIEKDVKSAEDVVKYKLQAYSDPYYSQYFGGTPLENQISPVTGLAHCLQMMRNNSSVACIDDCVVTRFIAQEDNELHICKDEMFSRYYVLFFRHNSPFKKRFELICLLLLESGITQNMLRALESYYKKLYLNIDTKIRIDQLRSAFYVLFMLQIVSLIIFFVELIEHYVRKKLNKI